jgi:hypothetical protein
VSGDARQRACDRPAPLRRLPSALERTAACTAALLGSVMIAAPGVLFGRDTNRLDGR